MSAIEHLSNFGTLVYTVGDGAPHGSISKTEVNLLSRGNAQVAVDILSRNHDALLFIAGGNSGEKGKRSDGVPASLREAERMKRYLNLLHREGGNTALLERVLTDCDPAFLEAFSPLWPSGNTIENAKNAAAVCAAGGMTETDIVAEVHHLPRVISTFRKQLIQKGILASVQRMTGHPVLSSFEETNDQTHLRNAAAFQRWEILAKLHHILTGAVPRYEFTSQWLQSWYTEQVPYQELCTEPIETQTDKEEL